MLNASIQHSGAKKGSNRGIILSLKKMIGGIAAHEEYTPNNTA